MKKIEITPVLLIFPVAIIAYIKDVSHPWTAFSFYMIVGFILMMCFVLLIDRSSLPPHYRLRTIWIIETICIILVLFLYLR